MPRQKEGDGVTAPEVTQFKASQKLLNPNEPPKEKRVYKSTKKKQIMLQNRAPYVTTKASKIKTPNVVQSVNTEESELRSSPHINDDEDHIFEKKRFILPELQKRMQEKIQHKREMDTIKRSALSEKMKNLRKDRTLKFLTSMKRDNSDSDVNEVKPIKDSFDFFDPDDDYLECIINSDTEMPSQSSELGKIPQSNSSQPSTLKFSEASLKSPGDLSKSGYYRRKKNAEEMVEQLLGPGHKIITDKPKKVTIEKAAEYYVLHGCKDAQYQGLDRQFYPCLTLVKQYLKKLRDDLKNMAKDGLASAILNDLNTMDNFPFENVRVNIGVDQGKDTSKIVYTFVDLKNPQSPKKLRVYKVILGKDNRENLLPYLILIDESVEFLQSQVFETKHGFKTFICFYIADCKAGDETLGLQGGSSTCPCGYCNIPSKDWKNLREIPDSALRTIEQIIAAGKEIEEAEADKTKTPAQIRQMKIMLKSVKATPMMKSIPVKRFVPPVVHIGISAVSSTVKYCKKNGKGPELLAAVESIGVKTHQGTSDYTGPNCRKILKFFIDNPQITGFGIDLLRAYAKIEKYAVARDLTEEEIDEMEEAIKQYFSLMDKEYPDFAGTKIKLHILRFHVIPFVREFKSWGKFSEQALEAIHKVKNQLDLRIKSGDDTAKIEYFMAMQMLTNHFYKDKNMKEK